MIGATRPATPKQPMKLQQPRNYDFGMFQFNLLGSQGGNSREMTTSPPGHHWEATVALTTAAKLQQFRANSREMTSQKLNNRCHRSMRFCVVSWLLSFQVPLGIPWDLLHIWPWTFEKTKIMTMTRISFPYTCGHEEFGHSNVLSWRVSRNCTWKASASLHNNYIMEGSIMTCKHSFWLQC